MAKLVASCWSLVVRNARNYGYIFFSNQSRPTSCQRGFTLAELIVVTAIMVIVTSVVLANNNRFGGKVLLQNFAYDVALTVRQAQVYGIGVLRPNVTCSGANPAFCSGYSMHFDLNSATSYFMYADSYPTPGGNGIYDSGADQDLVITRPEITRGYKMSDVCYSDSGGAETCHFCQSPPGACTTNSNLNVIDITFKRPDPDACIGQGGNPAFDTNSASPTFGQCISTNQRARIRLLSPNGDHADVIVESTGQITVQ